VALAELGQLAHAHRWPALIWIHDRLRVQAQIARGELADASVALDALRAYVDRFRVPFGAEMQPVLDGLWTLEKRGAQALRASADLNLLRAGLSVAPIGLRPTIARLLLELGDRSAAQGVFEALAANDFANVPRDIGYLGALASLGVLAILLDDRARAQCLYELLARYPMHTTLNLLSLHEGSVSHFLGLLAAYLGMEPDAERHFEDALAMNERIGQRPQLARTCYEYGRWLSARRQAERARELYARSRSLAESLGMDALLARLSAH
jgi:tetratricopeptide (TPR) repeat protein